LFAFTKRVPVTWKGLAMKVRVTVLVPSLSVISMHERIERGIVAEVTGRTIFAYQGVAPEGRVTVLRYDRGLDGALEKAVRIAAKPHGIGLFVIVTDLVCDPEVKGSIERHLFNLGNEGSCVVAIQIWNDLVDSRWVTYLCTDAPFRTRFAVVPYYSLSYPDITMPKVNDWMAAF
jgi:hypothetical protein